MNEIERVAREIRAAAPPWFPKGEKWGKISADARNHWQLCARAAIEAMREPTKGIIEATICDPDALYANERREDHAHIWRTMIDAILATAPR